MWPPQLTQRIRVLLHAHPLLDLRNWDAQRDPETRHYDSLTLAMRIFDYVIEVTGFGEEIDSDAIVRLLTPFLIQMDSINGVATSSYIHHEFISALLGKLRNDRNTLRRFELPYKDFSNQQLVERQLEFRLLEERALSDDHVVLQLSLEAINLFLNALDLDIEDAQIALEAIVQAQLQRGNFDKATVSARDAASRSIQFESKIERVLRDTRRDITRVDWHEQTPKMLREALEHINARLVVEKQIVDTARQRLHQLEPGSTEAEQVALIAELMDTCAERHVRLHGVLLDARRIFFTEQDRQSFTPRFATALPNLFADALEPLLGLSKQQTLEALYGTVSAQESVVTALLGTRAPGVFSIQSLLVTLLRPRRDLKRVSSPNITEEWLEETPEVLCFSTDIQSVAQWYLPIQPTPLSILLDRAATAGEPEAVLEYITLHALQVFGTESIDSLTVQALGRLFACHGFWGDDLELQIDQAAISSTDINAFREET